MQELEQVTSLLNAWESAVVEAGNRNPLDAHLARMQGFAPIDSIVLQWVDANAKSLKVVLAAGGSSGQSALDATLICSEAKWSSVNDWCRSGVLIQQAGAKRTGKLNTLTPDAIANEVFGDDLAEHLYELVLNEANITAMPFNQILERFAGELSTEALMYLRRRQQGLMQGGGANGA